MNRRDITDLFVNPPSAAPNELLYEAGKFLEDLWSTKLKLKFPDKRIDVYFQYALPIIEITFYQVPDRKLE